MAKKVVFPHGKIFIKKAKMKVKLTLAQLKKILQTEEPKFPITIIMSGIDREELKDVVKLLKAKKKN